MKSSNSLLVSLCLLICMNLQAQKLVQYKSFLPSVIDNDSFYVADSKYFPKPDHIVAIDAMYRMIWHDVANSKTMVNTDITSGSVYDFAVTNNGQFLVVVGDDYGNGFVDIINQQGETVHKLKFKKEIIYRVACGPGIIALSNDENRVYILDDITFKQKKVIKTNNFPNWEIVIGDHQSVFTGGDDNTGMIATPGNKMVPISFNDSSSYVIQTKHANGKFYTFDLASIFVFDEYGNLVKELNVPDSTNGYCIDENRNELILIVGFKRILRYDITNDFAPLGENATEEWALQKAKLQDCDPSKEAAPKYAPLKYIYFSHDNIIRMITMDGRLSECKIQY